MDAKHSQSDETSARGSDRPGVVVSRRRFTRAGLSGSVVLGSLASKPVLGASSTYHCTVSGQVSGNLSRATINCGTIGKSRSNWLLEANWSPIVKGTLPNSGCSFSATGLLRGTDFNGYTPGGGVPALTDAFFNDSGGGTCTVVTAPPNPNNPNLATMLQVLNTTSNTEAFQLGRATVISLLNCYRFAPDYPVTAHTIIAMFNATFNGGNYQVVVGSITVLWDRTRVIQYLSSLYPP